MELSNGSYTIQNIPVQEISKKFGTPLFVYDADKIVSQIKNLKTQKPWEIGILDPASTRENMFFKAYVFLEDK